MQQVVVVTLVKKVMVAAGDGIPGHVPQQARAIEVRRKPHQRDKPAIARIVRGLGGDNPTRKQMCERRHATRLANGFKPGHDRGTRDGGFPKAHDLFDGGGGASLRTWRLR